LSLLDVDMTMTDSIHSHGEHRAMIDEKVRMLKGSIRKMGKNFREVGKEVHLLLIR